MLSHPTHSIPSPTPCNSLPPSLTRPRLLAGNHITTRALLSPTLSLFSPLSQLPDLTLPACPRQVDLLSAQLKRVNLPSHSLDLTTSSDPTDARHSHTAVGPARLPHTYARTYIHNLWVVAAHLTHICSPRTFGQNASCETTQAGRPGHAYLWQLPLGCASVRLVSTDSAFSVYQGLAAVCGTLLCRPSFGRPAFSTFRVSANAKHAVREARG